MKVAGAHADADCMAEVTRWRKYGKDRLYVKAADGTTLGYRDLVSGDDHLTAARHAEEFAAAITGWIAGLQTALHTNPAPIAAPEPAPPTGSPWEDLAQRRAGAMAREQAVALKVAAPVRTFVARVLGMHTDERAWRIGADGEEKVAAQLAKLAGKDPRWRYLHAIPVGEKGSDIDHLAIGPGGVFSLNAKHHPGAKVWVGGNTLMINGHRHPYIRNSRHEARRAGQLLTAACGFPVEVTGVVVPVGADDVVVKTPPEDVHVVNRMRLARWLRGRPTVLDDARVVAIFEAARRSTTWLPVRA